MDRRLKARVEKSGSDAAQTAQLIANAEGYYRVMYYGSRASWNLRDRHMFDTLQNLIRFHGERSKAIVWAQSAHIGDASATEMSARGVHNLGDICRKGFGTDHGTVAAASDWHGPMEIKQIQPAHPQSYERQVSLDQQAGTHLAAAGRA